MKNILLLLFLLTGLNTLVAQQGMLDPDFSADGLAAAGIAGYQSGLLKAVAVQPDTKILAMGLSYTAELEPIMSVVRFNPDGDLDPGFGNSQFGICKDAFRFLDHARAMVVQSNGNIIVGGDDVNQRGFALTAFTPQGDYATGQFGNDPVGLVYSGTYFGGFTQLHALALQADGKIVAAGSTHDGSSANFALVRYSADGFEDNSFSFDGKVTADFSNGGDIAFAVAIQPDGKIVAGGHSNGQMALARFRTDGSLDQSFGFAGKVKTLVGQEAYISDMTVQPDGKILVAGASQVDQVPHFTLLRYLPDGQPDTQFGNNGLVLIPQGYFSSLALQPDGKIVAAGAILPNSWAQVYRFLPDGNLDFSFGWHGQGNVVFDADFTDVALQADGKIVAAGYNPTGGLAQFMVARYQSAFSVGAFQPEKQGLITQIYPNPATVETTLEFSLETPATVSIRLYNSQGQILQQILPGEQLSAGTHQIPFDLGRLPAGVYQLLVQAGDQQKSIQVLKA